MKTLLVLVTTLILNPLFAEDNNTSSNPQKETSSKDFRGMSASQLQERLEESVGYEDNWKFKLNRRFFDYLGFTGGFFTNYEQRTPVGNSPEQREAELYKEAQKLKEAVFTKSGRIDPINEEQITRYYKETFSNPESSGNMFLVSIQSERRLIAEAIIQTKAKINYTAWDRLKSKLLQDRSPLIRALMFIENTAKGLFPFKEDLQIAAKTAKDIELSIRNRISAARKYGAPLLIEFESASLKNESPWMQALYRSLRQFSSSIVQTPNNGVILVIEHKNLLLAEFSVSAIFQYVSNTTTDLMKKIFFEERIRVRKTSIPGYGPQVEYDYMTTLKSDDLSRRAAIELRDFWLGNNGRLDSNTILKLWEEARMSYNSTGTIGVKSKLFVPACKFLFF